MSKLNLVILPLCVIGIVIFLFIFPFCISLPILIPATLFFLYTDYKNQQSTGREQSRPRHAVGLGLPSFQTTREFVSSVWRSVNLRMQKYYIGLLNQASGNPDVSVPSLSRPRSFSTHSHKFNASSNAVRNGSNLDENRLGSSTFYRSNGSHSYDVGLSPIRLIDNSPTSDLRNLRISDRPRPMESSLNLRTRNQSLTSLKSPLGDASSTRKPPNTRGSPKNIQSIAGPLLASTRYNLSLDTVAYTDVTSSGLSSRVVKYASNQPATHQQQYSGPGQFPTIQLAKSPHVPLVSRRQVVGRTPVRIRIAPPEFSERRSYISPSPTQLPLHLSSGSPSSRSSLDRLKEISRSDRLQDVPRKRLHAQLGEAEDEAAKKQRVSDNSRQSESLWNNDHFEDTTTSKRGREESPKEDSETKRSKNNEIFSSLSSSRNLTTRTNKRKQSSEEWSHSGSHASAGKQAKTSVSSPDVPATNKAEAQTPLSLRSVEMETVVQATKSTPNVEQTQMPARQTFPTEEKLPSVPKMTAISRPRKDLLYHPSGDISGWVTTETFLENETTAQEKVKLAGEDLKNQRELDAKRRLSSMMFIVGEKEDISQTVFTPTSSSSAAKPVFSTSNSSVTPTSILSSTAFQDTSTPKNSDKHVHFADNLTQVKTFSSSLSNSNTSSDSVLPLTGAASSDKSVDSNKNLSSAQMLGGINKTQETSTASSLFSFGAPKTSSDISSTGTAKLGTATPVVSLGGPASLSQGGSTQSPGFSFGSNVTTSASLPSYSSPGVTTQDSMPSSLKQTLSTPVFGQSPLGGGSTAVSAPAVSTATSPLFGFPPTPSSTTASTSIAQSSKPVFGGISQPTSGFSGLESSSTGKGTATSLPSFGTSTTSVSSSPATTGFGFPVVPTSGGFGDTSTSGSSTFGTTPIPPTSTTPASSAVGTSTTTVGFGMPSAPSATGMFATPTAVSTSNVFGTPATVSASNVFGTPTTVSASNVFGTPTTVSASNVFGTPTTVSASNVFGTPTVSASNVFGTPTAVSTSISFGTPSTVSTSNVFGAQSTASPGSAFGTAVSSTGSGFATPTTSSSAFGTPSTSTTSLFGKPLTSTPSVFGTPSTVSTTAVFGAVPTSGGFGTTSSTSVFGTPSTTSSTGAFGTPSTSSTSVFGTPSTTSSTSVFGTAPTMTASGGFGTTVSTSASGTFGTPSSAPAATNLFSFGSTTTTPNQPMQTTTAQTGFGGFSSSANQTAKPVVQGGFSFGGSSATNTTANTMFGANSNTPTFGMTTQAVSDTGNTQGFKIDFSQANKLGTGSTLFGSAAPTSSLTVGSNLTDPSKQTANSTQNAFQFGANTPKPFSFGASSGNENVAPNTLFGDSSSVAIPLPSSTQSTPVAFGQGAFGTPSTTTTSAPQQKPGGLFSFGSGNTTSQQPTNTFTFGSAATNTAQSGGFGFGAAATQGSQAKPTGGFAFGAGTPPQTTQAGLFGQPSQSQPFQFGTASTPSGGFNFGSSTSNAPPPAFTAGASSSFQMGSAPQASSQGMFSIGSGSSAPRARAARLMRRQR